MTNQDLENTVLRFMDTYTTMSLACCAEGRPWVAAVYYARDGFDLIFFSSPQSRHATFLAENPKAAATIHGDYKGWKEIKGLQLEGLVEPITGVTAKARALTTYLLRYPFVKDFISRPGLIADGLAGKMAKIALYVFRPDYVFFVDNEIGFGKRQKLEIRNGKVT
jgi:uncharacterized protein YhbP (UPF0306 family)